MESSNCCCISVDKKKLSPEGEKVNNEEDLDIIQSKQCKGKC